MRRRPARAARASAPRWRARPKRSAPARAASSSSPICSRPGGTPATKAAVPDGDHRRGRSRSRRPPGNVAVTAARREGQAVVAAVHNFGQRAGAACRVHLRVDGRELATERVDVAPQAAADVRLDGRAAAARRRRSRDRGSRPAIRPTTRDIWCSIRPRAVPIIVITAEPPGSSNAGLYVERALTVADDGRAFQRPGDRRARVFRPHADGDGTAGGADRRSARARSIAPAARRIAALLPRRRTRAADTRSRYGPRDAGRYRRRRPRSSATRSKPTGGTVTLVAVDGRHPIFRPFLSPTGALGDVYVEQYRRLKDQAGTNRCWRDSPAAGGA